MAKGGGRESFLKLVLRSQVTCDLDTNVMLSTFSLCSAKCTIKMFWGLTSLKHYGHYVIILTFE